MILCFDIDNVITKTKNRDYSKAKPNFKTINLINDAYDLGAKILIFTGRFYGRCNGKIGKIISKDNGLTKKQLCKWKVKYHKLQFGKPVFDIYVDDKNFEFKKNWQNDFRKHALKKLKTKT